MLQKIFRKLGFRTALSEFHSAAYLRHNQRRQEHLATLRLDLAERSVLEVGAGIGDHTSFFLDRGCEVTITEARPNHVKLLQARFPRQTVRRLDLDAPDAALGGGFQVVYNYGTLYHLSRPAEALTFLASRCTGTMLLETCVSVGEDEAVNLVPEDVRKPSQAVAGVGCRPTRRWVFNRLAEHFPHVYLPVTQPWHEEFPLDWSAPAPAGLLTRAVFVASRAPIASEELVASIPMRQRRH